MDRRITLKEAIKFHGHLGPYLILGILAGELALKKLKCKKYFAPEVKVWGAIKRPQSCLIDGLQLSTGATFGKGNIEKFDGVRTRIEVLNEKEKRKIILEFKDFLLKELKKTKTHRDSEVLAKRLYKTAPARLFNYELLVVD